jgi:hypothetical protein
MPCPSRPPLLDHCKYIWRRIQVMKIVIKLFSPTSYYFLLFGPDILVNTLFSNTLSLCFTPNTASSAVKHPPIHNFNTHNETTY